MKRLYWTSWWTFMDGFHDDDVRRDVIWRTWSRLEEALTLTRARDTGIELGKGKLRNQRGIWSGVNKLRLGEERKNGVGELEVLRDTHRIKKRIVPESPWEWTGLWSVGFLDQLQLDFWDLWQWEAEDVWILSKLVVCIPMWALRIKADPRQGLSPDPKN